MRSFYLNSFYMFSLSFALAMSMFHMKLSGLYNNLGFGFVEFTVVMILLFSLIFGFLYKNKLQKYIKNSIPDDVGKINIFLFSFFIILGAIAEVWFSGQIPLLSVYYGLSYEYREFGIATFHVFFLSYVSASAIVSYERFLLFGTKRNLVLTILGVLFTIAIVNRAAMLMIVVPCFLMYLSLRNNLKSKIVILSLLLISIIAFGYIGDKRMISSGYTDDKPIFRISQIDNPIMNSLPSGFTWFYTYMSSPYANLVNQEKNDQHGRGDIGEFITVSILPDFISKRIDEFVKNRFNILLITPELQVSTGFGWSVAVYGIAGIILTYLYMCFLIVFFTYINRKRSVLSIAAILSTASALMVFNNMLVFAACIIQLVIISFFCGRKINVNGKRIHLL